MNKEAATIISSVIALVTAIIGLLVAFGIDINDDRRNAIIATLSAACGVILLVGPIIRQFVFSKNTVNNIAQEAAVTQQVPDEAKL